MILLACILEDFGMGSFEKIPFDYLTKNLLLSPSYTVTILATTELRLTPIYQGVMHRHES